MGLFAVRYTDGTFVGSEFLFMPTEAWPSHFTRWRLVRIVATVVHAVQTHVVYEERMKKTVSLLPLLEWGAPLAGILFVVAVVVADLVATSLNVSADQDPITVFVELNSHGHRLLMIASLSIVYVCLFMVYLGGLWAWMRRSAGDSSVAGVLVVLAGGLGLLLHAVPDIGLTGLYASKLMIAGRSDVGAGIVYAVYVMGYAIASVADVFLSVFALMAGLFALERRMLPRWLGWVAIVAAVLLVAQAFTLGGLIASIGTVIDGLGLLLFLVFVAGSSVVMFRQGDLTTRPTGATADTAGWELETAGHV
jgi:hypothetical protein